jgi:hypothetical protein
LFPVSAEARYYYVDAQNQATGPIAMAGLLALKAAGTVTDATLVVVEGGKEWVAFSILKPAATNPTPAPAPAAAPQPAASPAPASHSSVATSPSSSSASAAEPLWASQLTQKIDQLTAAMDKLAAVLEKSRPAVNPAPVLAPATAALHAEKINLNPAPKPGIAAQNPASAPGVVPRPTPLPAGVPITTPKPAGLPVAAPRPGTGTTLSPLAVPANAQKSALPLPALGKAPGPAPAPATAKGNIFSKFLKK